MTQIKKFLFIGLFLFMAIPLMSLRASASLTSSAGSLLGSVQQYMDATQLNAFSAAFAANQASATPMTPEAFFLDYVNKHPEFQKTLQDAVAKAKAAQGIKSDQDLSTALQKQIDDLKKQLDDSKKLTDDQKKQYDDLLKKYDDTVKQMQDQLANANQAAQNAQQAAQQAANSPQQQDSSQMMMMMMMMLMQMMQGKQGGGGGDQQGGACPGGQCGG